MVRRAEGGRARGLAKRGLRILGVHSATDANHSWPEYGSMLGARFDGHPWTQDFAIDVVDADHPATAHLGTRWQWHDEVYLFADLRPDARVLLRLAEDQVDLAAPGGRVPECGFPLAWSVQDGSARTLLQRAGPLPRGMGDARLPAPPGRGPRLAGRRPRNLTPMSGSSSVDSLPEVMAAAVYQSPGVVTVEERSVPRPGPDQVVVRVHACGICGSDIHQLRDGWGFTPGRGGRPRMERDDRRRRG